MAKGSKDQAVSERLPVARVAVDISLAHLDRPFDYLVSATMDEAAVPGCRVRVRFAGQLVDGYLLDRIQTSEHQGKLARLERVISPEPVLTPEIFDLARAVADRYAGTLADVLRLAIPPRHATAEREAPAAPDTSAAPGSSADPGSSAAPGSGVAPGSSAIPGSSASQPPISTPVPRPEPGSWTRYPAGQGRPGGPDRARVADRDRHRRRHHGRRRTRCGHRRPRRPRPGPCRRRADRREPRGRARPRLPDRRSWPGRTLSSLAGRAPGRNPGGGGHPGRDVRPGLPAGPGRPVG